MGGLTRIGGGWDGEGVGRDVWKGVAAGGGTKKISCTVLEWNGCLLPSSYGYQCGTQVTEAVTLKLDVDFNAGAQFFTSEHWHRHKVKWSTRRTFHCQNFTSWLESTSKFLLGT